MWKATRQYRNDGNVLQYCLLWIHAFRGFLRVPNVEGLERLGYYGGSEFLEPNINIALFFLYATKNGAKNNDIGKKIKTTGATMWRFFYYLKKRYIYRETKKQYCRSIWPNNYVPP